MEMTEESIRQLILSLEKLASAANANASATKEGADSKTKSDFLSLDKSPVLKATQDLTPDKLLGSFAGGISSAIQAGFVMMARELVAPLTNTLQNIGKEIASGMQSAVTETFKPRQELREIAQQYAEAGKPLAKEELSSIYEMLETQSKARREAVFMANEVMGSSVTSLGKTVLESTFYREVGQTYYQPERDEVYYKQQKMIYDNWKTQGQ